MKSRTLFAALLGICLIGLTGCIRSMVPRTHISGTIAGQPFTIEAPKDAKLRGLEVIAEADGSVSIAIAELETRMNPDVISTTADAQVKMFEAVGREIRTTAAAVGTSGASTVIIK